MRSLLIAGSSPPITGSSPPIIGSMGGSLTRIVGILLLAVVMAAVVSPWFDLDPTALRTSQRSITQFILAVPRVLPGALPGSYTFLTDPIMRQSHSVCDIVARDCARLC